MFKIDKNQVFRVKFNELEKNQQYLDNVSGLYFYHVDNKLKYVGQSDNLWHRFNGGYLKEDSKQHRNPKLMKLIKSNPNSVEVIFAPMDEYLLKEQETLLIQKYIPEFNEKENPRYEIHPIQKVIGRIVKESNREWTFSEMRKYLFDNWWKQVSYERMDKALADYKNLTNHCKQSQKKKTLNPKEKKTA
ncbi:GIY-YIG nuclease family protein [Bacillus toyonensis]|uniref:GIY-YIG nuclease family protein n=1 Tax=Bacillus toyonensis TaxID=155322 RepID=UPI00259F441B|nr:GIY-YIG nuclease family protein [Bacillus toyonensis]MDM5257059.1 GIY-YIG nuclease family protein [Bacillus toyonensis]